MFYAIIIPDTLILTLPLPLFFFNAPATPEIYTLSLHDALPISEASCPSVNGSGEGYRPSRKYVSIKLTPEASTRTSTRSEEHTSELQSPYDLVCRLLLEKKKKNKKNTLT